MPRLNLLRAGVAGLSKTPSLLHGTDSRIWVLCETSTYHLAAPLALFFWNQDPTHEGKHKIFVYLIISSFVYFPEKGIILFVFMFE